MDDGTPTLPTSDAREQFSEVLNRAAYGKERVVLTRRGKPIAAVVPIEDVEALEAAEDARDVAEGLAALEAYRRDVAELGRAAASTKLEEIAPRARRR